MGRGLTVLLDSCILIDHFNGHRLATGYLAAVEEEAAVSVITRAEVLAGFDPARAAIATGLLDRFPTFAIEIQVADLAAQLRRQLRLKMPDALQAALAQYHGLLLATRNSRDFPPERFPSAFIPYVL